MAPVSAKKGKMLLKLYRGDAKTLLAFNFTDKSAAKDFAGFTIQCQPKGQPAFYIFNNLQFERPADHAQDLKLSPRASINAPIHKFRWVHVPGSIHQGIKPFFGNYTYTVTPRYFDNGKLKPLDPALERLRNHPDRQFFQGQSGAWLHPRLYPVAGLRPSFRPRCADPAKECRPAVRHREGLGHQRRRRQVHLPGRI